MSVPVSFCQPGDSGFLLSVNLLLKISMFQRGFQDFQFDGEPVHGGGHNLSLPTASNHCCGSNQISDVSGKSNRLLQIVLPIIATAVVVLGMFGYFLWRRLQKQGRRNTNAAALHQRANYFGTEFRSNDTLLSRNYSSEVPLFSFGSIIAATDYFSSANKLGEGGFGHVYKGKLQGGQEIAVKALSKNSEQGLGEFRNEVELIAKL
ncbi:receptor-like serine/threonine-protein kinase SD1-8 [Magnolia sinica]|uniref:receptor-like serine/threonine-protein kinase SD1-8 n=1 Tax=Magnolia sinica TaxID=86752 RepID=UPI00265844EE|nr:receptor-like serine/threonine-protein kinase SD1-8 [Magnolia sinica]